MGNFRYSICEPLNPKIIEKGKIEKSEAFTIFKNFPWINYLIQMEKATQDEIYFSPSLEIENLNNKNGLSISAVGTPTKYEFYIFFKRPKKVKIWFGLRDKIYDNFVSDLTNPNEIDVLESIEALLENDLNFLELKFI